MERLGRGLGGRRRWLSNAAALSGLWVVSGGCYYGAEEGEAYEPWLYPGADLRPERLIVGAAILASSPHNTQPWWMRATANRVDFFSDASRNLGSLDGLLRELTIGLGCALENGLIAARAFGLAPELALFPSGDDPAHIATVTLGRGKPMRDPLFDAIPHRHTYRGRMMDDPPPEDLEAALAALCEADVRLTFVDRGDKKHVFRSETIAATEAIVADRSMLLDGDAWWRQTAEDIERHRDGVTIDTSGLGAATRALGKMAGRPSPESSGEYWLSATREVHTRASAFVILSTANRADRAAQVAVGRTYQRIHLWATSQGLAVQPLNQLPERQDREQVTGAEPRAQRILASLIGDDRTGAQMLFRIGFAFDEALKSPRRPYEWVVRP